MTRKMPLEKRLVNRDRLHSDAFRSALVETNDSIDHQKWITMRQDLHDLVAVETSVAFWHNPRNGQCLAARLFFGDCTRELRVRGVARFDCDQMSADSAADQREIANNVQD